MNPLAVLLTPLLAVLLFEDVVLGRNKAARSMRPAFIWLLLAQFVLFGILRNLPYEPFTALAPH